MKEQITNIDVQNAIDFTDDIVNSCPNRFTGQKGTKLAVEKIQKEFESYCDKTETEDFTLHPNAFLGWIRLLVILYTISVGLLWFDLPLVATLSITLGIVAMVYEFFLYKKFIDPFWKKTTGTNVIGTIEPQNEVKQQIVVSGHHDAAYVFNFLYYQPNLYPVRLYGGLGSVFLMFLFSLIIGIIQLIVGIPTVLALIWKICATILLLLVLQMWFFRGKKATPGAGDNMIAVAIANQIGHRIKEMKLNGNGLKNTRVIIGSWDAEEAGLRGARAYSQKNEAFLKSIPTYVFNMDCVYNLNHFFFLTTDINGSVKLSTEMAKDCQNVAKNLGYPVDLKPIAFLTGGTDAGEFGKIGVEATSLLGMPWGNTERSAVYHTPKDVTSSIEPAAIKAAIEIGLTYIIMKDVKMA